MKKFLFVFAAFFAATFIFFACKKGIQDEMPEITSNSTVVPAVSLDCCVEDFSQTVTPLLACGNSTEGFLYITALNDANKITVEINRTGDLNGQKANEFTRVEWIIKDASGNILETGSTEQSDNAPKASYTFTYTPSSKLVGCTGYKITITIKGLEGFDGNNTEQACTMRGENGKGVFEGNFDYTVKAVCVSTGCSMSQGYFFAKPQSVWVGGTVTVGGVQYTKEQGSAIFKLSCNTAGKLGFQQVATLYLSIAKGSLSGIPAELAAHVATIESFLNGKNLSAVNACSKTFDNKAVQQAAGAIGNWIDMEGHHCSE